MKTKSQQFTYFIGGQNQLILPPTLILVILSCLCVLHSNVFHSSLHLVSDHLLLLFIEVVLFSGSLFLHLYSNILSIFFVMKASLSILLLLFISPDPLKFLHFLSCLLHLQLCWEKLLDLSVWGGFSNDIIDLCPSVSLLFVY